MSLLSPLAFGHYFRPNGRSAQDAATDTEAQGTGATNGARLEGHGREGSGRSMLSNFSNRLSNMHERERETERNRQEQRVLSRRDRLLNDLNRLRDVATGRAPFQGGGAAPDLEAQAATTTVGESISRRGGGTSAGKSRREREEGAALFGPNLANYFGSGSSSSGAVASPLATGIETNANTISIGSQRRSRLGSRGRARGASLSGLSNLSLTDDAATSALSLPDHGAPQTGVPITLPGETMTMAEGIELDTIKRWIDRSVVGGALEIPGMDAASAPSGDAGNPPTLCSTLQSYVNLKRNTVKLNVFLEDEHSSFSPTSPIMNQAPALRSVTSFGQSITGPQTPNPTHLLQFEYDCAAPNASIQVFVRASRKHGSWVAWTSARETAGLPAEMGMDEDIDSRFFAQRGPPPHVLGWPVHASRLKKGFGKPLKAAIALELELYAPPKESGKKFEEGKGGSEVVREAETPAIDASKRLGDDLIEPGDSMVPLQDPLARLNTVPVAETKEAKAAREKAERETLKVTIVVEALDEDGKTLSEPNLQTTYLRVASLPIRPQQNQSVVDASNVLGEDPGSGPIQDVALPAETEEGQEVLTSTNTQPRRIWSLQVEGQEAEIGPHRFQLQELYGLSSRPPPPQQEEHNEAEVIEGGDGDGEVVTPAPAMVDFSALHQEGGATECLICLSAPPTTLLLPCTHGLCLECAVQLRDSVKAVRETERRRGRRPKRKYACPVCRRAYTNMLNLSTADEKNLAQAAAAN